MLHEIFNIFFFKMRDKVEIRFKLKIIRYNATINYQLSLKFKLLKNGEFTYFIKILTESSSLPCFVG